jgi:hypothetical protein
MNKQRQQGRSTALGTYRAAAQKPKLHPKRQTSNLTSTSRQTSGFISYVSMLPEGLKPDVLFCYDLRLPRDFVPKPQDGEVGPVGSRSFLVGRMGLIATFLVQVRHWELLR